LQREGQTTVRLPLEEPRSFRPRHEIENRLLFNVSPLRLIDAVEHVSNTLVAARRRKRNCDACQIGRTCIICREIGTIHLLALAV
jgi:hypothetical protein